MPRLREVSRERDRRPARATDVRPAVRRPRPGRRARDQHGHARRLVDGVRARARRVQAHRPGLRLLPQPAPRCSIRCCASSARPVPGSARGSQFVFSQHCKSCRIARHDRGEDRRDPGVGASPTASRRSSGRCSPTPTASCSKAVGCPTRVFDAAARPHLSDEEILELTYITSHVRDARHDVPGPATRVRRPRRADRRDRRAGGLRCRSTSGPRSRRRPTMAVAT